MSFCQVGLCCAWSLPRWGQAEVVSTMLHPGHSTRYVLSLIPSVLSPCSKDLKQWTSVVAWLQLRVVFGKQRKVHPQGGRADRPQKREAPSWLLSLYVLPPSPESALCKLSKPRGPFIFPEILTLVLRFSFFFHFRGLFHFFVF